MSEPDVDKPPWKWFLGSAVFFGLAILSQRELAWDAAMHGADARGWSSDQIDLVMSLLAGAALAVAGVRAAWRARRSAKKDSSA